MSKRSFGLLLFALLTATGLYVARAGGDKDKSHPDKGEMKHVVVTPDKLKWGPAPPSLPAGAELAVVVGDPKKAGPYVLRAKFPDGYKVMPHWHPTAENVTVLKGKFLMGTGEKFDEKATMELPPGGFSHMPKGTKHFAMAKGETIVQVHGVGPFEINYVNPADDPRKK
jgi:quercetin dioxygenase-like cupin family protein